MNISRLLITLGVIFILVGLAWPWLQKLGLGRLPGDIFYEKDNVRFYFPIVTSIIISLILTLLLWFFKK
jgi:ribose/xylose/arabinose/galactoside ABC-type transport system permease subunit